MKRPASKRVAKSPTKPASKRVAKSPVKPASKKASTAAKGRSSSSALSGRIGPRAAKTAGKAGRSELETVSWWDDFYRVVRRIPRGKVTTYGAVAMFAGRPRAARHVGYAMAALEDTRKHRDVPWQRVLGAAPGQRARVTIKDPIGGAMQRALLEAEGVVFDALGRIALSRFGWKGPG